MVWNKRGLLSDMGRAHVFYFAEVISTVDPDGAGRIKARIQNMDDEFEDSNLPWSFPLIPKFFNVVPKVGEGVRILMWTVNSTGGHAQNTNRTYIGPLIGQPQYLVKQDKKEAMGTQSDTSNGEGSYNPYLVEPLVYPDPEYISVQGRQNADIIFTKQEINLRAGQATPGSNISRDSKKLLLNKKNPPRIQLKMVTETSATNIYSDKIHLITYGKSIGSSDKVGLGGRGLSYTTLESNGVNSGLSKNIPDSTIDAFLTSRSEPLIYGDKLVYFLTLLQAYCRGHEHVGAEEPPIGQVGKIDELLAFNLDQLKNENIRIN
jgi:hypothetical protein|tara:strand:+ start:2794 stop:3750 length:957 start_codon:yes stop_codon:yes gene_type:complete